MKDLFINFLTKKKIHCRYFAYLLKHHHKHEILSKYNKFFETHDPSKWIDQAFQWSDTDEGNAFWNNIHQEWLEVVKKESMQTYDVKITCAGTNAAELAVLISKALEGKNIGEVCCK